MDGDRQILSGHFGNEEVDERSEPDTGVESADPLGELRHMQLCISFRAELAQLHGYRNAETFKSMMTFYRNSSAENLFDILHAGRDAWLDHPQFYNAIAQLLFNRFQKRTAELGKSGEIEVEFTFDEAPVSDTQSDDSSNSDDSGDGMILKFPGA